MLGAQKNSRKIYTKRCYMVQEMATARFFDFKNGTNAVDIDRTELGLPGIDSAESQLSNGAKTSSVRSISTSMAPIWDDGSEMYPKIGEISLNFGGFGSGLHFLSANAAGRGIFDGDPEQAGLRTPNIDHVRTEFSMDGPRLHHYLRQLTDLFPIKHEQKWMMATIVS